MPQSSVQDVQEDEDSGEVEAGSATGGQGGCPMSLKLPKVSVLSPVTLT